MPKPEVPGGRTDLLRLGRSTDGCGCDGQCGCDGHDRDHGAEGSAADATVEASGSLTTYAGDLTPQEAWEMLKNTPSATLVDIRNEAEWRYLGVPDLGDIGGRVEFIECTTYPDGVPNPNFIDQLAAAGLTSSAGVPVLFICRAGHRSVDAAIAATMAGLGPCYNVLDGFEGELGEDGHRGHAGWRAVGLPWYQQ